MFLLLFAGHFSTTSGQALHLSAMGHQHHTVVSGGEINCKEGCSKDCTQIKFTFLLEISPPFKICLQEKVRRIPMSQGFIHFKTIL